MREYRYDNAIVRITIPTEEQKENIRKSTEMFVRRVMKERRKHAERDTSGVIQKE